MDLLEKFATVEIRADNRFSAEDRQYCDAQQAAYQAALAGFKELAFFVSDMKRAQEELLGGQKDNPQFHDYLLSPDGPDLSQKAIDAHIEHLHTDFIHMLVRYFNEAYHVAVDGEDICKSILPKEPTNCTKAEAAHYREQIQTLTVPYQSVMEQIILRLDGRSFSEQAFHEICERCHRAAWNIQKHIPKFEVAKGTIHFLNHFSNYECGICERWKLTDDMREILRGAVHFETWSYHSLPRDLPELLDGKSITVDFIDWPSGEKIRGLKMFKNGRVDLKFSNGELAGEFAHKYLGTTC